VSNIKCLVKTCDKPSHAKGYCGAHYHKIKVYGDPEATINETHGMRRSRIYGVWCDIKKRCFNPNSTNYENYGGRGIGMCEEWKNSFTAFYEDMGQPPTPEHSIERKDVNGNYEPSNCIWETRLIQAANKRRYKNNSTGFIGVSRNSNSSWQASISRKGKQYYLGSFNTAKEAATWRDAYVIANNWPHRLNFMEKTA